ncbi:MAG: TIGR03557 family F420-dependent LLM class oxidoreductase [Acidimicrobiales bacterium]
MQWGYTCSSEEFEASDLVRFAADAEDAGFSFVTVSDHFHPWTSSQGHSPYAWTTLGGIAARTDSVRLGTGVTCPLIRQHPAVVAQAAATVSELSDGRFFLGVGTGEALNEHVTGERWPPIDLRQEALAEAVGVMRRLWTGETVDHHGDWFTVENAKLFSASPHPIEIVWAAAGETSARLAAEHADGLWVTSPSADTVQAYRDAGGTGPVIGQLTLCWGPEDEAARTAHEIWPNAAVQGQLSQDLPTWTHFEQAAQMVTVDDVRRALVVGDDLGAVVDAVGEFADAGFTALHLHQVGADQRALLDVWRSELHQAVDARVIGAP